MSCHRVTRLVFTTVGRAAMLVGLTTLTASAAGAAPPESIPDPPSRVARISFLSGSASYRPAALDQWTNATMNYPLTIGDHLWTDRGARAELDLGTMVVRIAPYTEFSILNLDDHMAQLRVTEGSLSVRVRERADDEDLEVDTPNGAADLLTPGSYRIDVDENGDASTVTVRRGEAEVTSAEATYPVQPAQAFVLNGTVSPIHRVMAAQPTDEFEDWALARDRRVDNVQSLHYVSRGMIGYADLDDYGVWRTVPDYGAVWVPRVRVEWVPYRYGHWVWVNPWGWTWIDDAPWGFAPFHYGRWVYLPAGGWAWVPGRVVARPCYAPALVAFVGGSNWHLSLSIGTAPVGWFPLGPREPFIPAYRVSPAYVQNVNITHVNVTNINVTNVNNITYVNRNVPQAVTVVSRETFVQARPVAAAAVAVPREQVRMATVIGAGAPPVAAPQRVSVVNRTTVVAAPPPVVVNRQVVVRRMPPPQPAPASTQGAASATPQPTRAFVQPSVVAPARSSGAVSRTPSTPVPPPAAAAAKPMSAQDLAARHAREQANFEAKKAEELKQLSARHQQEQQAAANAQARAQLKAQHDQEMHALQERQKAERQTMQKRQADERKQAAPRRAPEKDQKDQKDRK